MQKYIILQSQNTGQLVMEVNEFLMKNKNYKLKGAPYSDGNNQCQALELKENKNNKLLLG